MKESYKKIIAIMMAVIMVFALCACGKKAPAENTETQTENSQTESGDVEAVTEDGDAEKKDSDSGESEAKEDAESEKKSDDVESLGSADNVTLDTLIGHYEVIHMQGSKNDVTDDDLQLMRSLGLTVDLDIFKDKSAKLTVFDEEIDLTVDVENRTLIMEDNECAFKFATDELTMYEGDSTMVFKKQSNTPGPVPYNQAESLSDMVGRYVEGSDYINGDVLEVKSRGDVVLTRDGEDLPVEVNWNDLIMSVVTTDEDGDETKTDYTFMFFQQTIIWQLRGDEKAPQIVFEPWTQTLADKARKEAEKEAAAKAAADAEAGVESEDGEPVEGADGAGTEEPVVEETGTPYVVVDETEYPELAEGVIRIKYRHTIGGTVTDEYEDIDLNGGRLKAHGSTAKAEAGYTFRGWEDADGNTVHSHSFYQPQVTKDSTDTMYIAVFANADGEVES